MKGMENHHAETGNRRLRHYAHATAKILGGVTLLAILVHVSWNMFAPDMFGLAAIRMKQAFGLVVFAGVFAAIFRLGLGRPPPSASS